VDFVRRQVQLVKETPKIYADHGLFGIEGERRMGAKEWSGAPGGERSAVAGRCKVVVRWMGSAARMSSMRGGCCRRMDAKRGSIPSNAVWVK